MSNIPRSVWFHARREINYYIYQDTLIVRKGGGCIVAVLKKDFKWDSTLPFRGLTFTYLQIIITYSIFGAPFFSLPGATDELSLLQGVPRTWQYQDDVISIFGNKIKIKISKILVFFNKIEIWTKFLISAVILTAQSFQTSLWKCLD